MLDQLYAYFGTRDIPGEPEALARLAKRVAELAARNGEEWVWANREILLMQWRMALSHDTPRVAVAQGENKRDDGYC
ncbi:MAG: hypothetical protein QNJ22_00980 [Desulfosarcinaceae bacterium]|nr:hypothetical protein [Desulfosarcinaceae bacterium]